MLTNLIVVDDYYNNPDEVRQFALSQEFSVFGNYPGKRTKSFLNESNKETIQNIIQPHGGNITDWFYSDDTSYTGCYQITTSNDRSWIHSDNDNRWAAVCYLTPNAPISGGTGLYKYKETGERGRYDNIYPGQDYTKWELIDAVGNIYNRLVIYPGCLFHASLNYFGNSLETGRLFQVFFFNSEF